MSPLQTTRIDNSRLRRRAARSRLAILATVAGASLAFTAAAANAGTYPVYLCHPNAVGPQGGELTSYTNASSPNGAGMFAWGCGQGYPHPSVPQGFGGRTSGPADRAIQQNGKLVWRLSAPGGITIGNVDYSMLFDVGSNRQTSSRTHIPSGPTGWRVNMFSYNGSPDDEGNAMVSMGSFGDPGYASAFYWPLPFSASAQSRSNIRWEISCSGVDFTFGNNFCFNNEYSGSGALTSGYPFMSINNVAVTAEDNTTPSVQATGRWGGGWAPGNTLSFDASDNSGIARIRITLDGNAVLDDDRSASRTNTVFHQFPDQGASVAPNIADGAHTAGVTVWDASGNPGGEYTSTIYVDNNAPGQPTPTLSTAGRGPGGWYPTRDYTMTWTNPNQGNGSPIDAAFCRVTDLNGNVVVGDYQSALTSCGAQVPNSAGTYKIQARIRDAAGQYSPWSTGETFRLDNTTPSTATIAPPADGGVGAAFHNGWVSKTGASSITFTLSSTFGPSASAGFSAALNTAADTDLSDVSDVPGGNILTVGDLVGSGATLPTGNHTVQARGISGAGLAGNNGTLAIKVDKTDPTVSVAAGTDGTHSTIPYLFTITGADAGSGMTAGTPVTSGGYIEYKIDAQPAVKVPGATANVSVAGAGAHTVTYNAIDAAGNTSEQKTVNVTLVQIATNTTPPAISGTPQVGQMLSADPGAWTSTEAVTYSYQWQRCDQNAENCADVPGNAGKTQSYTLAADDLAKRMRVIVTATNTGGSFAVPSAAMLSPVAPAPSLAGANDARGTNSTPGGVGGAGDGQRTDCVPGIVGACNPLTGKLADGTPNGTGATADASAKIALISRTRVRLGARRARSTAKFRSMSVPLSYAKTAYRKRLPLEGTLATKQGKAISGAELLVVEQITYKDWQVLGTVKTDKLGRFSIKPRVGPSRTWKVVYFPFAGKPESVISNAVSQAVKAPVTLVTSTPNVPVGGRLAFTGRIAGGSIPQRGVLVAIQYRKGKSWATFRLVRAQPTGSFQTTYRFRAGAGSYKFRARVVQQASYPFAAGASKTRRVTVN